MKGYLKAQGYYNTQIKTTVLIDTVADKKELVVLPLPKSSADTVLNNLPSHKDSAQKKYVQKYQRRVTIIDTIYTGKQTIIDSELYALETPRLQFLADSAKKASLIQPGKSPFAQNLIGAELNRLVTLYRQKGYFLIKRENLIAEADTIDQSLLNFSLDPFEQAQKIAAAAERRKGNPTAIVTMKQRENTDTTGLNYLPDSAYFKPYTTGNIYFYPEADINMLTDSLIKDTSNMKADRYKEYTMYYRQHQFYLTLLRGLTPLKTGRLYSDNTLSRTISNFNQLPAWRQVDYKTIIRGDSVDFYFFLTPAKSGNITLSLEGSRNTGDFLSTGTLIGTAFNIGYTAPNLFKSAVQYSASFSNGVEFTFDNRYPFLQTFLSSLNNTLSIPNKKVWTLLTPASWVGISTAKAYGTEKFSFTGSYSDRNNFFRIRSLVISHGFEWRKRNTVFQLKFPGSIELYSLDTLPLLEAAFKENPFLRSSFNTGSVVSLLQGGATITRPDKNNINNTNYFRVGFEESGAIAFIFNGLQDRIYRYIKFEGEYRRQMKWRKTSLALRLFAGYGVNYGNTAKFGSTLPFFKQFIAGGPNSMRAWGLRQLGLGSSVVSDTSSFRERYGDMQLEMNLEYRFPLASFGSVNIASAFFTDIGNIWNVRSNPALPGANFAVDNLIKDVAIGTGTGLRLDFSYFLIRLDFAIKVKDPARYENNGWLDFNHFTWKNYEYSNLGVAPRSNFAFQLGIGLPF